MILLKIFLGLVLALALYMAFLSYSTRHLVNLSQGMEKLLPCPDKPNCVSSESANPDHKIESFKINHDNPSQSWNSLIAAVEEAGGKIHVNDDFYCHAVFTSTIFRFKDDFEALLKEGELKVRSASRAGTSDLGQNRKRVEKIRQLYLEKSP